MYNSCPYFNKERRLKQQCFLIERQKEKEGLTSVKGLISSEGMEEAWISPWVSSLNMLNLYKHNR